MLFQDFILDDDDWHVLHSVHITNHATQTTGECDYIVINKRGVMVIEVKDKVVKYEEGEFWQKERSSHRMKYKRMLKNPFNQVFGNKRSIQHFLMAKNIGNVFVSSTVVFPKSTFSYNGIEYDHYWDISGNKDSFIDFIKFEMEKQKHFHIERFPKTKHYIKQNLTAAEIKDLVSFFLPNVLPDENKMLYNEAITASNRKTQVNFNILDGLSENRRILIQSPPSSGKAKYAYELIKKSIESHNEKGLYLCWSEFLAYSINNKFKKDNYSDNIYAIPYFVFIQKLIADSGMEEKLTHRNLNKIREYTETAIKHLKSQNKLPQFDFIVVDEAQDIFDKGIYLLLDNLLNDKPGVEKGKYFIFYDPKQNLRDIIDIEYHELILSMLKDYSAIYKLNNSFRDIGGPGIRTLIEEIHERRFNLTKDYGNDVNVVVYKNIDELPSKIVELVSKESINKKELTVLFTSNLISGNKISPNNPKPLDNKIPKEFRKLSKSNLDVEDNKIRYSTALKYKGLEDNTIVLILHDIYGPNTDIVHQFFIGASRAIAQLFVLIDEESMKFNEKNKL